MIVSDQQSVENQPLVESFASLLQEVPLNNFDIVGKVVKGVVVEIVGDSAIIDVGLKSEGRVLLKEFGDKIQLKSFDEVEVYIEKLEDKDGMIVLSREKAVQEGNWDALTAQKDNDEEIIGIIFGKVKGGFTVDIDGIVAFLPGSQLDIRPVKDIDALMNIEQKFKIIKVDRIRSNLIVSRRAALEETSNASRDEILAKLYEGYETEGIVKNITDYGSFIDLGGIDGLLHITDMAWSRLNHPTDMIDIGDKVKVKVVQFNKDTQRVSLGMKQLTPDPWDNIGEKYTINSRIKGKIVSLADYGAFVELESGIEGLIHISDISWSRKNTHPNKVLSIGQEVEIEILEIDVAKRRIALGLKQCIKNPWIQIVKDFKVGQIMDAKINNITEFGLFINIMDNFDGMAHMSDLSWEESPEQAIKNYKVNQIVKVKILEIDPEKERIALGIKQLILNPFDVNTATIKKGRIVTCSIVATNEQGLEVVVDKVKGFIKRIDLAQERSEQRVDRFAVGEKVDAKVMSIDKRSKTLHLSIKGREIAEEKAAVAAYGSSDSGASLGDILGAAMDKADLAKDSVESSQTSNTEVTEDKKTQKNTIKQVKIDDDNSEQASKTAKPAKKVSKTVANNKKQVTPKTGKSGDDNSEQASKTAKPAKKVSKTVANNKKQVTPKTGKSGDDNSEQESKTAKPAKKVSKTVTTEKKMTTKKTK